MKIIFLDFDGVLNSERYFRANGSRGLVLDPLCMTLLKETVEETDAKIVLSTSWREHWEKNQADGTEVGKEINEAFAAYGMSIFDKTPFLITDRESEVEAWLEENPSVKSFVVLDDRFLDSPKLRGHFVKTNWYGNGFDAHAKEETLKILMQRS